MNTANPIYYSCHTCHAQPGQPCRWGSGFHEIRVRRAANCSSGRVKPWLNELHAMAHGAECVQTDAYGGEICAKCGQTISRLKDLDLMENL